MTNHKILQCDAIMTHDVTTTVVLPQSKSGQVRPTYTLRRISLCLYWRLLRGLYTHVSVVGFVSCKFTWDSHFDICPINVCPVQCGLQM
jgi:hypothetical protein